MKYCFIGARGGVGCTSLALALGKALDRTLYMSLDFGAKDASKNLGLDPGIYDLYDVLNRGGDLEDALIKGEGLDLLEAPLTKSIEDLDRTGLGDLMSRLEEDYDHILVDLPPDGPDLLEDLDPDRIYCLAGNDLACLYRLDALLFQIRKWEEKTYPVVTGVEDPDRLRKSIEDLGLGIRDPQTLPNFRAKDGRAFFYPQGVEKLITEDLKDYREEKTGLLSKLFRGNE